MKMPVFVVFVTLALLTACVAQPTPTPTPAPTATISPTPGPDIRTTCIVTDVGSVDDGTFNQYAYEGLLAAVDENNLEEPLVIESDENADFAANIQRCLDADSDIIVTVGFLLQDATIAAADENDDVFFIGVDQDMTAVDNPPDNVVGIQFREDQAGFIVGTLAALTANENNSDTIAGIYGVAVPAVQRFRIGYEQGALYINPDWETGTNILDEYTGSFSDTSLGVEAAERFIEEGASVIFGAGGLVGSAGIAHAAEQEVYVIGVDQDEYFTTFEEGDRDGAQYLISSAIKRVDQGVIDMVEALATGRFQDFPGGQNYTLGVVRGGVGFAPAHDADIPDSIYSEVRGIIQLMIEGDITINVVTQPEATPEVTVEFAPTPAGTPDDS
jgi:basic membrane lipoprotein Med (substrate-binding protein (PBP1-ABC) superfamily)